MKLQIRLAFSLKPIFSTGMISAARLEYQLAQLVFEGFMNNQKKVCSGGQIIARTLTWSTMKTPLKAFRLILVCDVTNMRVVNYPYDSCFNLSCGFNTLKIHILFCKYKDIATIEPQRTI